MTNSNPSLGPVTMKGVQFVGGTIFGDSAQTRGVPPVVRRVIPSTIALRNDREETREKCCTLGK